MSSFDASMNLLVDTDSEDGGYPSPAGSTSSTVMDYDDSEPVLRFKDDLDESFTEEDVLNYPLQSDTSWFQVGDNDQKSAESSSSYILDPKWDGWADYDSDYLSWLLKAETRLNVFDSNAPFVGVRRLLIGWLNDSCASMNVPVTTARAALALLDYVLTVQPLIASANWDLIGLGCILSACKYAEMDTVLPLMHEVAHCGQYRYSHAQIREAELLVLGVTDWRLDTITPSHFITHHQQRFPEEYTNPQYVDLIESLLDCALLDYGCRNCRPSLIAEGVVNAARQALGMTAIPHIICTYPPHHISQVADLIIGLAEDFQQELIDNQAIR